ncbi:MAG TPA: GlsB/YeaQ/YmgE family stress response membrane protein [Allosphingosinicella sp.]|uniref:GlsB/YeaQ/YmgE family stress response membrane protein n=1 Tax=Allosphingosinicella sp. TaxID=2823234 RepID=UPI002ED941EE
MNLIIALIIGGIIGWLASIVMRTDAQQGILLNVVVGIIGSLLGGFLLGPLLGGGNLLDGQFDIMTLVVALLGAIILLAIVNMFRRGRPR